MQSHTPPHTTPPKPAWPAETAQAARVLGRPGSPVPFAQYSLDAPPTPETPPMPQQPAFVEDVYSDDSAQEEEEPAPLGAAMPPRFQPPVPEPVHARELLRKATSKHLRPEQPLSKEQRLAQREWRDAHQLLAQRAELLSRALPAAGGQLSATHSDAPLVEALREVVAEVDQLRDSRRAEHAELTSTLRSARQATAEFGALIAGLGAGDEYVSRLRCVVGDAAERLRAARVSAELRRAALAADEARLSLELRERAAQFEAWEAAEVEGHAGSRPRSAPAAGTAISRRTRGRVESKAGQGGVQAAAAMASGSQGTSAKEGGGADTVANLQGDSGELRSRVESLELELTKLGGATCGWDAEDHSIFMRARTQVFGPSHASKAFATAAAAAGADDGASADVRRAEAYFGNEVRTTEHFEVEGS